MCEQIYNNFVAIELKTLLSQKWIKHKLNFCVISQELMQFSLMLFLENWNKLEEKMHGLAESAFREQCNNNLCRIKFLQFPSFFQNDGSWKVWLQHELTKIHTAI